MNLSIDFFYGPGNDIDLSQLNPRFRAMVDRWDAAIRSGGIGFLPRSSERRLFWYAFASSPRQRRELLTLLDAWVGPTYSDLHVRRGELDTSDPFDDRLATAEVPPLRFEVLPSVPPHVFASKEVVRLNLAKLTHLANERPPSQFQANRTTVDVLDDLGHAIAAQDRDLSNECLDELARSTDLDESNLAFLRLRVYAGLGDWEMVFADPAVQHVLAMRRPLGVTRILQSALYHTQIAAVDGPGFESELLARSELWPTALTDLRTGTPPRDRAEATVEFICTLRAPHTEESLDAAIRSAAALEPGLDDHFRAIASSFADRFAGASTPATDPASTVTDDLATRVTRLMLAGEFAACIELGLTTKHDLQSGRAMVHSARQLSSAAWAQRVLDHLRSNDLVDEVAATGPVLRAYVEWLQEVGTPFAVANWVQWFEGLCEGVMDPSAHDATQSWDRLSRTEFFRLIDSASDESLARLGDTGGQFLAAHAEYLDSVGHVNLVVRLVAALALSGKASAGVRVQTLALLEFLVTAEPSSETVQEALEWTMETLTANTSATTLPWACDMLQTVTALPMPGNEQVLLSFFYDFLEAIRPYRSALSGPEVEALTIIAEEIGTAVPAEFVLHSQEDPRDRSAPFQYLAGKMVVLHSLTESASTRAAQILRRLVPGADIRTNCEHDGSPQLAQLSVNADLFVIVTASAKHAATTFITEHRRHRPIIRVNSRGSSAILRGLAAGAV